MVQRFQFSLRNVFAATTWLAVWAAMFPLMRFFIRQDQANNEVGVLLLLSWMGAWSLIVCLPFVAVGALVGKTATGWKVAGLVLLLTFIAVSFLPGVQ